MCLPTTRQVHVVLKALEGQNVPIEPLNLIERMQTVCENMGDTQKLYIYAPRPLGTVLDDLINSRRILREKGYKLTALGKKELISTTELVAPSAA